MLGDGALTGGMAYEGLNNLGHSGRKVIIILNDNGRSYAPTASSLSESLTRLRGSTTYIRNRARLERLIQEVPLVGAYLEKGVDGAKAALREMFEPPAFFEQLGVRYLGPYDGHDIVALEQAFRAATEVEGPVVVHCLTQKGRGYGPAEDDEIKNMHDTSELKAGSFTAAFSEAIVIEGEARPELVAITAAMPDSTGLLPFGERFPGRLIDVGIAEQHAVTAAAGMAMGGLRPVVALYSTFLTRAIDQVNLDVGLHSQPVVFVLDRAGITGDDGPSHHGLLDMVLLTKVPDMAVFAPSNYAEVGRMLHDALDLCTDGPAAIRFAKTMPPDDDDETGSGLSARKVSSGSEVCLIGVGKMLAAARSAAEKLRTEGHDGDRLGSPRRQATGPRDAHRRRRTPAGRHHRGRSARRWRRCVHRRCAVQARPGRRTAGHGARGAVGVPPPRQARHDPGPPRVGCRGHRGRGQGVGPLRLPITPVARRPPS